MERQKIEKPPAPRLIHTYDDSGRGGWYAGAIEWPGAPVIVFVPGLAQPAKSFWQNSETYGLNNMYAMAVSDGFRTAFVGFAAEHEKAMDMWHNGRILAWQIEDICAFFQVDSVIVVAHSKGGVDAQTAAVYYGAAPRIQRLYTLSSPHWGSELADLAYSSIGFPIGERMGVHSDGCYVMQTAYMRTYRQKTDLVGSIIPMYTFGGCGNGPAFSRVWAGAQILSHWGRNDGVVTVRSAHNPNGTHLGTLDFDHIQMQSGQFIWPHVRGAILGEQMLAEPVSAIAKPISVVPDGLLLRGGGMENGVQDTFGVDSGIGMLDICVMTVSGEIPGAFMLLAPGGATVPLQKKHAENGAQMLRAVVDAPSPGYWKLTGPRSTGAYLASIRFQSSQSKVIPQTLQNRPIRNKKHILRLCKIFPDQCRMIYEGKMAQTKKLPIALDDGLYSVENVLQGELDDGSPYERDTVRQIAFHKKRNP